MQRIARMMVLLGALAGCSTSEERTFWDDPTGGKTQAYRLMNEGSASAGGCMHCQRNTWPERGDASARFVPVRQTEVVAADQTAPPPEALPGRAHVIAGAVTAVANDTPEKSHTSGSDLPAAAEPAVADKPIVPATYELQTPEARDRAPVLSETAGKARDKDPAPPETALALPPADQKLTPVTTEGMLAPVPGSAGAETGGPLLSSPSAPEGTSARAGTSAPVGATGGEGEPPVHLVNSKRIRLNYEVTNAGPSGLADVELWVTQAGRPWQRQPGPPQHSPPYVVEVEEEDVYGFTLVGRSGAGLSKHPPQDGDLPQVWVEVDVTRPVVRLLGIEAGSDAAAGKLVVRWMASDKNLAARPISLSYARQPNGPWLPIAAQLENTGRYEWQLPPSLPDHVLVKVEAADKVGNVGSAVSASPYLGDSSRPNIAILEVGAADR